MPDHDQTLSPSAAQAFYDRFGKKQDNQGFYEDSAFNDLIAHTGFHDARTIFEFGCGTGKLAARLLKDHLSPSASYLGCDISSVMVGLAKHRLEAYAERAQVVLSNGAVQFPISDHSVDCVVSSYVLDLLSEADIQRFFSEAHRTLTSGGETLPRQPYAWHWPSIANCIVALGGSVPPACDHSGGGCRPIELDSLVDERLWRIMHRRVMTPFGVPSEVLILRN